MRLAWQRIFAFNQFERDRWVTEQAASIAPGACVLDVGAGSCRYRGLFAHCDYRSHDAAKLAEDAYGELDYISDILAIPVPDASVDVVLCTEVLEHVPEPIQAVREFARILKGGGSLLLTAPLGSSLHQEPYHFYGGFTPHWYLRFLTQTGFEKITIEPNGGFFKHYGQESQRVSHLLDPRRHRRPVRIALAPLWLFTWPWFRLIVPTVCHVLDRLDPQGGFTVGYHVRAVRR